jgi:CRP/FNR family transcriptional regulator, anaerobic regulatory protein
MIKRMLKELEAIAYLFEDDLINEIDKNKSIKKFKEGDIIIEVGQEVKFLPFVIEGAIKVLREDPNGEELLLYYLEAGETCTMTITCCLGKKKSKVKAIADTDATLLSIPSYLSIEWLGKYETWRNFVLTNYESKINELLEAIDSLAFYNMEERIKKYLSDKAKVLGTLELELTHQEIAEDLHSSRVVVSRLLKKMEIKKELKINRNKIYLAEI